MWLLNPNTVFEDTVLGIVKQTTLTTRAGVWVGAAKTLGDKLVVNK